MEWGEWGEWGVDTWSPPTPEVMAMFMVIAEKYVAFAGARRFY